jgi:RNA polymerase sigma factor (TIGR02999 family)
VTQGDITGLLHAWRQGDNTAADRLAPMIYDHLHRLANRILGGEFEPRTLQTTDLVHEAYLKLTEAHADPEDRVHFFALAARVMRHILVDHARKRRRAKRGGSRPHLSLDETPVISPQPDAQVLELDEILKRLAQQDQRKSQIVELLYFGGMNHDEAASFLKISRATLQRDLKLAKAWIYRELRQWSPESLPGGEDERPALG